MSHRIPIKVRFYELDPYNHLNHATYVQYFEVGRVELLESIGSGLTTLQEQGIQIARRTVAKYRDQLGILPARMRKRV